MICTGIKTVICSAILAGILLPGCDGANDTGDDNNDATCTEDLCLAWCNQNEWEDSGVSEWGKRVALCTSEDFCICQDYLCDEERCADWCVNVEGKTGGQCDIFDCLCQ